MAPPLLFEISPPLLNTANPWATDLGDLTKLYDCPHTGAVTTRTSLLAGFLHNPAFHQHVFFESATHDPAKSLLPLAASSGSGSATNSASLNSYGYSPLPLEKYLEFIREVASHSTNLKKGFLVSVTGSPEDVAECYRRIASAAAALPVPLAMEVNLSCPNVSNQAPPAYNGKALLDYVDRVAAAAAELAQAAPPTPRIPFGLKTPPYTHPGQFATLQDALLASADLPGAGGVSPISFLTATNTLGSCLVLTTAASTDASAGHVPALPTPGMGGMAGAPLHPLALGNVSMLSKMVEAQPAALGHVRIVGAGGVSDAAGFARMKSVGAYAVGVGTGLGIHGVGVFEAISEATVEP